MTTQSRCDILNVADFSKYADVAELADALDSGSSGSNTVWVQVPSSAPKYRLELLLRAIFFMIWRDLNPKRARA